MPDFFNTCDFHNNQATEFVFEIFAGDVTTPVEGRAWYDGTNHVLKIKDNAAIRTMASLATPLSSFAVPIANVAMNGQRLTGLADPSASGDAATKNYVDLTIQGLQQKVSARVATAAALPTNTYANGAAGVGATLTASANGVLTVDGIAVALGDVILVRNEAATANNGLYTVTTLGTASVPYVLTRHPDMDQAGDFAGAFIPVESGGTANANTLWLSNITANVTVGTTSIGFTQLNSATAYSAGVGIGISAGVISITNNSPGTARDSTHIGGTASAAGAGTNTTTTNRGVPTVVTGVLTGTGAALAFTFNDNLATVLKTCQVTDSSNKVVYPDISFTANTTVITFGSNVANAVTYNVVIQAFG